jgi:heat shock protein HtpX
VYHFRGLTADGWDVAGSGHHAPSLLGDCIAVEFVPAGSGPEAPRFHVAGETVVIELELPGARPGMAVRCRIRTRACDLSQLQRSLNRAHNHRRAGRVLAGMILLLALCGWIIGGDEGVRWALASGDPSSDDAPISPAAMRQRFGAQLLHPADFPTLYCILTEICRRANLARPPDLYGLPGHHSMNAYALGGPRNSAITLTEGLLHGMTPAEIAGILAHEVAHIRNNDAWAMSLASALHRAIALASLAALAALRANGFAHPAGRPLALLLGGAPAIGQLLWLGLSRIRELDADATALDLIDNPLAFVAALQKLERHHTGTPAMAFAPRADGLGQFLSSHPATGERVGALLRLA